MITDGKQFILLCNPLHEGQLAIALMKGMENGELAQYINPKPFSNRRNYGLYRQKFDGKLYGINELCSVLRLILKANRFIFFTHRN